MSTIKEDGTSMLTESAAQDYIHELESHVRLLRSSQTKAINLVSEYQSSEGFTLVANDWLQQMLATDDVLDALKDSILDGLPDLGDLDDRLYELENKPDEYEITETVVDSMTFESRVAEIVDERLQELTFKVIIEE